MAELRDENDDALTWGDEVDDPSHIDSESTPNAVDPDASIAEAAGSGGSAVGVQSDAASSVLLVVYGVLAGAYALCTVGWIVAIQSTVFLASNLFIDIMFQFGEFLAIASPALWFATVVVVTTQRRVLARVGWLLVGLVIVAPWPFILAGAAQ